MNCVSNFSRQETARVVIAPFFRIGAVNETQELLMHHLHEHTLPCYHESLSSVLKQLRNNDLQIATRIFLRQGYFPVENRNFLSQT